MKYKKKDFTSDESMMLMLYFHEDRTGTIASLRKMREYLTAEETELLNATSTLISKLEEMTDTDFLHLEPIRNLIN